MSTRMDRYKEESVEKTSLSRVAKNDSLYDEIKSSKLSRVKTNNNIRIIESNGKTINIDKIKKYLEDSKNDRDTFRRTKIVVDSKEKDQSVNLDETKEYDINTVLEKAKKNREIDYETLRYKKLKSNENELLDKIKQYEKEYKDEYSDEDDDPLNTEERTLVDLLNTAMIGKNKEDDLLSALTGGETGEITLPIEKEKNEGTLKEDIKKTINKTNDFKEITITKVDTSALRAAKKEEEKEEEFNKTKELRDLKSKTNDFDNSFFTNSISFSKEDFEGFEELEKSVKKNNIVSKILFGLLIFFVLVSLVLIVNYVFKLGLFK